MTSCLRRKSPKTHQGPPGPWTSGTRGRTPLDSPGFCPSGIGGVSTGSAASSQGWRGSGVNRGPIRDRNCWAGAQTAQTAQPFPNSSLYISNKYLFIKTLCSLCSRPNNWRNEAICWLHRSCTKPAQTAQSRRCISPFTNTPHLAQKLHADVQLFYIFLQFLLGGQVFASYPGIGCPCAHNPRAQKKAAPITGTAFFSIFCLYNSSVL